MYLYKQLCLCLTTLSFDLGMTKFWLKMPQYKNSAKEFGLSSVNNAMSQVQYMHFTNVNAVRMQMHVHSSGGAPM